VIAMMILSAVAGLGLVRLYRLAFPSAPPLVDQTTQWERARRRASRLADLEISAEQSWSGKVAEWFAEQLCTRRPDDLRTFERDLAITGRSLEEWLTKTLLWMLTGLLTPIVLVGFGNSAGLGVPFLAGPAIGVVFAAVMIIGQVSELRSQAAKSREDLRRALTIYLDLVVMSMEGGRGHAEALPTVAKLGTGWAFNTLHDAIDNARPNAITPWEALGRVGERYGVPELLDLRGSLTLAQDEGGSIRETLISRAQTMREARIADAHARANKSTEAMRNNLMLMALVAAAYVITARVLFLFTAS
jgi:tight adherence protein C